MISLNQHLISLSKHHRGAAAILLAALSFSCFPLTTSFEAGAKRVKSQLRVSNRQAKSGATRSNATRSGGSSAGSQSNTAKTTRAANAQSAAIADANLEFATDSLTLAGIAPFIRYSGYDHRASDRNETLCITNSTSFPIRALKVRIEYFDLQQRMLHSREATISEEIPAGETRTVSLTAPKLHSKLYYKKSTPPKSGGMPYDITIKTIGISCE